MPLDQIDVILAHILYHKVSEWSDSGVPFLIARSDCGIVKGEMHDPKLGVRYRLYGEHKPDSKRGGDCFEFYSFQIVLNRSEDGIIDYMVQHIPGLGPSRAKILFGLYGLETIDHLRADPAKVLSAIPGVGEKIIESVIEHFESTKSFDPNDYAAVYGLLADYHPPKRVVEQVLCDFGSSAVGVIKENPYILLGYHGLGWKSVDSIAIQKIKYDSRGIHRFKAAIIECLSRIASDGDTYTTRLALKGDVQKLCGLGGPYDEALAFLESEKVIEIEKYNNQEIVAEINLGNAEREVAHRIKGLIDSYSSCPLLFETEGLEAEQIDAVKYLELNPVALLIGAPGVGKTYTSTNIIRSLHEYGHTVVINAPTGRAAKRAGEVLEQWLPGSGIQSTTIHKALGSIGSRAEIGIPDTHAKFGYARKSLDFVHDDTDYIDLDDAFVDESSMIDVSLLASYLRAIPPGSRILFTGDENQLPSVGPGAVLRDMIEGGIPFVRLTTPRRNSGRIVRACHAIRDGKIPEPAMIGDRFQALDAINLETGDNWVHIEESDPNTIADIIVWLHGNTVRDPLWDLQVISPQNSKLPIACANLNRLLSAMFNPQNHSINEKEDEHLSKYAIFDKVVRLKNGSVPCLIEEDVDIFQNNIFSWKDKHYKIDKTYVVNGDIGQILDILKVKGGNKVIVQFMNPDRLCLLPLGDAQIQLAYAVTCHKFQGCGSPVVILPVHHSFYWDNRTNNGLWNRELFYTMVSRAEDVLITVGKFSAIELAVSRKTVHRRKTRLARFIKEKLTGVNND